MFLCVITYPVISVDYSEVEAICRGMVNVAIFIFVYTRDVLNELWLGLSIVLSMVFIILSFWRVCTRDDCEKARERTLNLLSCYCCIPVARIVWNPINRAKDVTFKDETNDIKKENSLDAKL